MDLSQVYHTFWYLAQSVSIVWENRHLAWRDILAGLRLQPGKGRIEVAHLAVHHVRAAIPYLQVFLRSRFLVKLERHCRSGVEHPGDVSRAQPDGAAR
jgi:hypothetical protein